MFWKVTGRDVVTNLGTMICTCPAGVDFFATCALPVFSRGLTCNSFHGQKLDMRLSCEASSSGSVKVNINFVQAKKLRLACVTEPRLRNTRSCSSWVREPRTDGIRAYDGKNWHSGRQLIVYWLRNLQRHLIGSPYFRASTA